jgi:hypothetical protein
VHFPFSYSPLFCIEDPDYGVSALNSRHRPLRQTLRQPLHHHPPLGFVEAGQHAHGAGAVVERVAAGVAEPRRVGGAVPVAEAGERPVEGRRVRVADLAGG